MKLKKAVLLAFVLVLSTMPMFVGITKTAEASETIYIRSDGSIDPQTANITTVDNVTYALTADINESVIIVERGSTVIDGNGYTAPTFSLSEINNVTIRNTNIVVNFYALFGIILRHSSNNTIHNNNIANQKVGIWLDHSHNNTISGNNITNGFMSGVSLDSSLNNTIQGNTIRLYFNGIQLDDSSNYNTIYGNNVTGNWNGLELSSSSNNTIYHNNFVDNHVQVSFFPSHLNSINIWDNGTEGNYWSDYIERYPNATEIGGTWDTPYVIDENNQDNYPIVPEFPTWTSMLLILTVLTVVIAIHKRRLLKTPNH